MGIREELADGNFGVMTCVASLTDEKVAFLATAVPERGEHLWVRFRTWQNKDGNADANFGQWVDELLQAALKRFGLDAS